MLPGQVASSVSAAESRLRSTSAVIRYRTWTFVFLCAAASVWVRTGFPAYVIGGAAYDDALFAHISRYMLLGEWLGPFNNNTLVKGMGYPAFIAFCFALGIPLKIGETLVYLGASALASAIVRRITGSHLVASLLFAALAFNPLLWSNELARVIREGLYISLTLASVMLPLALVFPTFSRGRATLLAFLTGLVWGSFCVTREEGVWLAPSILVVVVGGLVAAGRLRNFDRAALLHSLLRLALAAIVAGSIALIVATLNYRHYGAFETVEVQSSAFKRAYGALYRVPPAQWQRYIVFPEDVRSKLYAISPAARELQPAFEGSIGEDWKNAGCRQTHTAPCPEILAGWFQWALRDAVAAAGHYKSAATAKLFYERLAEEIDAACKNGRLECSPERHTLAPPFRTADVSDAAAKVPELLMLYWREGLHTAAPLPSVSDLSSPTIDMESVTKLADLVGGARPTEIERTTTRIGSHRRTLAILSVVNALSAIYAVILVSFIMLGILGSVMAPFALRRPHDLALLAVTWSAFIGVAVRIGLLCYLEVTAIPSISMLYFAPASPLLILAAISGSLLLWRVCQVLPRILQEGLKSSPTPAYTPRG